MAAPATDPFYLFRDDLRDRVTILEQKHGDALGAAASTKVSAGDFRRSVQKVKKELRHAQRQLGDLEMTVRSVEKDRVTFAHIDDAELQRRRDFISGMGTRIRAVGADVESGEIKVKLNKDEEEALKSLRPSGSLGAANANEMTNTGYIHDQQARSQLSLRQQDETLVELGESVDRVGLIAGQINGELADQNKMLDGFEADIDRAAVEMNFMMGKIAKLLKTNNTCQIWVVIILALVIVVLVMLIIYV